MMIFESREHKINYLLKENRENMGKIISLLREISNNEREIIRLCNEVVHYDR